MCLPNKAGIVAEAQKGQALRYIKNKAHRAGCNSLWIIPTVRGASYSGGTLMWGGKGSQWDATFYSWANVTLCWLSTFPHYCIFSYASFQFLQILLQIDQPTDFYCAKKAPLYHNKCFLKLDTILNLIFNFTFNFPS